MGKYQKWRYWGFVLWLWSHAFLSLHYRAGHFAKMKLLGDTAIGKVSFFWAKLQGITLIWPPWQIPEIEFDGTMMPDGREGRGVDWASLKGGRSEGRRRTRSLVPSRQQFSCMPGAAGHRILTREWENKSWGRWPALNLAMGWGACCLPYCWPCCQLHAKYSTRTIKYPWLHAQLFQLTCTCACALVESHHRIPVPPCLAGRCFWCSGLMGNCFRCSGMKKCRPADEFCGGDVLNKCLLAGEQAHCTVVDAQCPPQRAKRTHERISHCVDCSSKKSTRCNIFWILISSLVETANSCPHLMLAGHATASALLPIAHFAPLCFRIRNSPLEMKRFCQLHWVLHLQFSEVAGNIDYPFASHLFCIWSRLPSTTGAHMSQNVSDRKNL